MASPLNKWSIYDCFYVRIELNDIVKERASLLGIELSEDAELFSILDMNLETFDSEYYGF